MEMSLMLDFFVFCLLKHMELLKLELQTRELKEFLRKSSATLQ